MKPQDWMVKAEQAAASAQAEARRYVADHERGPIEADDAQQMIEQSRAFIATIRAALSVQDSNSANTTP